MKKYIFMIVYTDYQYDARVRREAETLAICKEFDVTVFTLRQKQYARKYDLNDVHIVESREKKYDGRVGPNMFCHI